MTLVPKIGYSPLSGDFSQPGDYRRFVGYAKYRGIPIEIAKVDEKYDLVVLSQGADISTWCDYSKGRIVYDFVDSYLSIPYSDIKGCLRGTAKFATRQHARLQFNYWETIRNMCRRSDAVVCTAETQRSQILPYCDNTHIVLDMHDSLKAVVKSDYKATAPYKLVWEGLPGNISQLAVIRDVLCHLNEHYQVELHLVTDLVGYRWLNKFWEESSTEAVKKIFNRVIVHEWAKETCASIVSQCDVAVIPIDLSDPMVTGKPENKLLLLWRMGMPVVTSATPAYVRTMEEAGLSLSCKKSSEWVSQIEKLLLDEESRRDTGRKGLDYVTKYYSKDKLIEKWDHTFQSVGFDFT
jgi:glycosyltransferase involved in cell wall biosynthesis